MKTYKFSLILKGVSKVAALVLAIALAQLAAADELEKLAPAVRASQQNRSAEAVAILDGVIKEHPKLAQAYYWRGRGHFRLGNIDKSLADFDRYIELDPPLHSRQWERGITCYYAGEYKKGADQFELYQTYHDQDVENSVWRYLCVAAIDGVEKARANLLPIKEDPRVPMMEIYDLYRGQKTPDDVFAAAKAGKPSEAELSTRLFYAHLYVGLYYESQGKAELAKPHIDDAAGKYRITHYMGDVARIHAERLENKEEKEKK